MTVSAWMHYQRNNEDASVTIWVTMPFRWTATNKWTLSSIHRISPPLVCWLTAPISLMKCLHTNLAQLKCCYCLTSPMTKWMCDTEKLKRFRWTQFTWREHFLPLNCHALFTVIRPYTATPTMLSHLLAKNNATVVITCKMPWARVALLYNSPTDVKSLARMLTRVNKTLLKRRNNTAWSYISSGQRNNAQY